MKSAVTVILTVSPIFFTNNYSNPIIEEGVLLRDMIYLKKK